MDQNSTLSESRRATVGYLSRIFSEIACAEGRDLFESEDLCVREGHLLLAEAMSSALESYDDLLCSKLPDGLRVHDRRRRTLATKLGDVMRLKAKREAGRGKDGEARELRRASGAIRRDYLPRMERYERQQAFFAGRNSFSKTDADATFMRMKDDPMGNGQLKAAYNVQAGTENQFIVDTTVHRRPGDAACAIPHCEHVKERIGHLPAAFVADAGYGSEENYAYLEREGVDAYVKHNEFGRKKGVVSKSLLIQPPSILFS